MEQSEVESHVDKTAASLFINVEQDVGNRYTVCLVKCACVLVPQTC